MFVVVCSLLLPLQNIMLTTHTLAYTPTALFPPSTNKQSLTCLRSMDRLNHDVTALAFSYDGRLLAGAVW